MRLLQKPDTVYRDSKQRTALHYASAYGHPEVVRLLIQKKFDLNAWDSDHDTALIKAVKCYEEDCVSILLEHGANPNITNAKGNTALHYAVYSSKSSLAAKLLSHGADAEAKNKEGLTPLMLALRENRMEAAALLKKTGTKNVVNEPERYGSFFKQECAQCGAVRNPRCVHSRHGAERSGIRAVCAPGTVWNGQRSAQRALPAWHGTVRDMHGVHSRHSTDRSGPLTVTSTKPGLPQENAASMIFLFKTHTSQLTPGDLYLALTLSILSPKDLACSLR
nr:POTE ankyrin domain family member H [Cavia porcellus]